MSIGTRGSYIMAGIGIVLLMAAAAFVMLLVQDHPILEALGHTYCKAGLVKAAGFHVDDTVTRGPSLVSLPHASGKLEGPAVYHISFRGKRRSDSPRLYLHAPDHYAIARFAIRDGGDGGRWWSPSQKGLLAPKSFAWVASAGYGHVIVNLAPLYPGDSIILYVWLVDLAQESSQSAQAQVIADCGHVWLWIGVHW